MEERPETPAQRRRRLEKRDRCRNTVCVGCRSNYYNYPKPRGSNGDVEVEEDYSCWHLSLVRRGSCGGYQRA